jgi:HPt (histidine-containing phosphotransfer) domain-containing protein
LLEAIARILPPPVKDEPGPSEGSERLDKAEMLRRVDGDLALLRELADLFWQSWIAQQRDLQAAIVRRDGPTLRRVAHAVKGAAGNFGATEVVSLAQQLEHMGQTGDLDRAASVYAALEKALDQFRPALAQLIDEASEARPSCQS